MLARHKERIILIVIIELSDKQAAVLKTLVSGAVFQQVSYVPVTKEGRKFKTQKLRDLTGTLKTIKKCIENAKEGGLK